MSVFNTPYPHASIITFAKVLGLISFSIAFILIVFQPFGTSNFVHSHKLFILSGYGGVIFLSGTLTYILVNSSLSDSVKDRWTIGQEVLVLFFIIVLCQSACFFYWSWLFAPKISFTTYLSFLTVASTVALLPIGFYLFYIYQKYKDVQHALKVMPTVSEKETTIETLEVQSQLSNRLKIEGTGKREKYEFEAHTLYLVKAEDNYVILYSFQDNKLKKWMVRATMNDVEGQLTPDFLRIHRSYIINKNYIENIEGNVTNTKVKIHNIEDDFPVSRGKVDQIRQFI